MKGMKNKKTNQQKIHETKIKKYNIYLGRGRGEEEGAHRGGEVGGACKEGERVKPRGCTEEGKGEAGGSTVEGKGGRINVRWKGMGKKGK